MAGLKDSMDRKPSPMTLAEARQYVLDKRNHRFVSLEQVSVNGAASRLECMDGRRTNVASEVLFGADKIKQIRTRESVGFPGGALGLCATILSALNTRVRVLPHAPESSSGAPVRIKPMVKLEEAMNFFEGVLGGMSCHTDDHQHEGELACMGCGHAMGLLTKSDYGLGETYQKGLQQYSKDLQRRAREGDESVTVYSYSGEHEEQAVFRIRSNVQTGKAVTVVPNDGNKSMFVINEVMNLRLLREMTTKFHSYFGFKNIGISSEELNAHVASVYHEHIRISASALARGKPVYDIVPDENDAISVVPSNLKY